MKKRITIVEKTFCYLCGKKGVIKLDKIDATYERLNFIYKIFRTKNADVYRQREEIDVVCDICNEMTGEP